METIRLLPIDEALARSLSESSGEFEATYGARCGESEELVREVVKHTLAMLEAAPREPPWGGYLVTAAGTSEVVGTCSFKRAPDAERMVEIAYFTFPLSERQGYATAMANALLEIAFRSGEVRQVVAHTLPERNASTRVLEKVGLRFAGPVEDAEDGTVWRWERSD